MQSANSWLLLLSAVLAVAISGNEIVGVKRELNHLRTEIREEMREMREMYNNLNYKIDEAFSKMTQQDNVINELTATTDKFAKQVVTDPVAFSAYRDSMAEYGPGETVIFGAFWANLGDAYDFETGEFTCPVSGLYYFSFGSYTADGASFSLQLVRDGSPYTAAWSDASDHDQGYMSAIIPCLAGSKVWLRNASYNTARVGELTIEGACVANSFTGFLMVEI